MGKYIFKNKRNKGFTMIELLVIMFIVSFISTILIVNWRTNEKRYQLQRTAQEIIQLIRLAQNFALTGRRMAWPPPTGDPLVPKYYGVHFEKNSPTFYFVYGDVIGNPGYQSPEDIEETHTWTETGTEIDSFGGGNTLDLIFSVPDGFVDFYPSGTSATITIKRTGKTCPSSDCKSIIIKDTGEISIQ